MQVTAYNMIKYMYYMYIVKSKCKQQQQVWVCATIGRSFLIVPDLKYVSWPLTKGTHPTLYPAFQLMDVFQVASFLLLSPQ